MVPVILLSAISGCLPVHMSIKYDVFYHVRFAYEHILVLYLLLHA